MKTKRAFLVRPGKLEVKDIELDLRADELLIKVEACGLCTWELNHYHGRFGDAETSLGHEYAGIVVDKGADVVGFEPGDVVTGLPGELDGFSEYMTVKAASCEIVDPSIDPQHALGEPLKCIVTVLRAAAPEAGDYGVVIGAGPMGLWAIQGLAGNSLSGLIAVDVDAEKLKLAASYGATHTINPLTENAFERLREITKGHMADFVIEGTGNTKVVNDGIRFLRIGRGRLVLMSSYKAPAEMLDIVQMTEKAVEMRVAHPRYSLSDRDDLRRAVRLLNNGVFKMDDIISHRFRLDQIQDAFESLDKRPAGYLKGIVVPHMS